MSPSQIGARPVRALLVSCAACVLFGCSPPAEDPGPGTASQATVETWMEGEVFGAPATEGQQWLLAWYSAGEGEICMALGLTELDPASGTSYANLPVYTAQVSSVSSENGPELVGEYHYYSEAANAFSKGGEYGYRLDDREVSVIDAVTGYVLLLTEAAAELTNDDLVALLQPCHGFEADASPAPRGEE